MESSLIKYVQLIKDFILNESRNNIECFQFEEITPLRYLSKDDQLNKLNFLIVKFYDILNSGYPFVAYNFKNNIFDEENFFSNIPFSIMEGEGKINIDNIKSNKDIKEFRFDFVRSKYLEMALRERDLILNSKNEQLDFLNANKTDCGIMMYPFIFETNTQNAYSIAEEHNLSEYDRDYILCNFWPIVKVNSYDLETIQDKINSLKKEFIKENTIFDLEIFKRKNTEYFIFELKQYIDVLKRGKVETWDEYGNENFYIFKMDPDKKDFTLIISDKNIPQLEIYFKSILSFVQEFIKEQSTNQLQNNQLVQTSSKYEPKLKINETEPRDLSNNAADKFINNFDNVTESKVIEYFTKYLVETKYLSNTDLFLFLNLAFNKMEVPKQKLSFDQLKTQKGISNVFYNYYKITAGKPYGKQKKYFNLLCDYFNGFENLNIKNFSK